MVVVTVSGTPGSGKTTACRLLGQRLGLEFVSTGHFFRAEAEQRGMSLADFGLYCETHPEVDRALDARQVERLRQGNIILEGRLAGWMAHREGVAAVKVWVDADEEERARRIANREGGDVAQRLREMRDREASERIRYLSYYGIDLRDRGIYDLVVQTTSITPEEVVRRIVATVEERRQAGTTP